MIGCVPYHCQHAQINVLGSVTGIVYWNPPQQAMDAVVASAGDHSLNQYGSGAGLPDLVKALEHKLATENGITQVKTCCMHAKQSGHQHRLCKPWLLQQHSFTQTILCKLSQCNML